jgi:homoserine kinase
MASTSVTVRVPATTANLGPGFDSLGVALDWTARITVTAHDEPRPMPNDALEHMTLTAVLAVYDAAMERPPPGLSATYEGDMPIGRGLGISAAARAAGVVAANELLGHRVDMEALVPIATRLEGHGDNVIPALLGGFQIVVEDDDAIVHTHIEPPTDLRVALLTPDFIMPTNESRQRLPTSLTRNQAVHNIGRAALMVAAITQRRYELLHIATQDVLHQPARATLFPAMYPIFEAARHAGAHGVYLSGGGSTIAAFVTDNGEHVAGAMREAAASHGLRAETRVVGFGNTGTEVIDG